MSNSGFRLPFPVNEPVRLYAPGSTERESLKLALKNMPKIEIPLVIGGKEVRTGNLRKVVMPHSHGEVIAEFHVAGAKELEAAVKEGRHAAERIATLGREPAP